MAVVTNIAENIQNILRGLHSLFLYAHTYVTPVNITWSVSNLVPQFMDSIYSIKRPVM